MRHKLMLLSMCGRQVRLRPVTSLIFFSAPSSRKKNSTNYSAKNFNCSWPRFCPPPLPHFLCLEGPYSSRILSGNGAIYTHLKNLMCPWFSTLLLFFFFEVFYLDILRSSLRLNRMQLFKYMIDDPEGWSLFLCFARGESCMFFFFFST